VVVGPGESLATRRLWATDVNLIAMPDLVAPIEVEARIRHGAPLASARLLPRGPAEVELRFAEPQRAVCPGQSVVFYQGDLVVGGGVIARAA
jgi:tRNA-specific 2-thiouridylase